MKPFFFAARPLNGLAALGLALALAACAEKPVSAPFTTAVVVQPVKPQYPAECTSDDPKFPDLPDRDVTNEEAARDRALIKRRWRLVMKSRSVCRAAHLAHSSSQVGAAK